jgi:hypothetical protein
MPFPWKTRSGQLNIQRWRKSNIEQQPPEQGCLRSPIVIDATADSAVPVPTSFSPEPPSSDLKRGVNSLYGSLRRDVYEDSSDDESAGSPQRDLPMAQTAGDTADTESTIGSGMSLGRCYSSYSDLEENSADSLSTASDTTDDEIHHFVKPRFTLRRTKGYSLTLQAKSLPVRPPPRQPSTDHTTSLASARPMKDMLDCSSRVQKNLPNAPYNRPRRVLVPSSCLPFVTISMRADAQFFHREKRPVGCSF